jgi:ABC-type sugar transport system permease subunit/ABC-type glycerol-3-phosphate transport system substrate-binding protein
MKIDLVFRFTLAAVALCTVAWSFGDVCSRGVQAWLSETQQPVTLTILHWGDQDEEQILEKLLDQFRASHRQLRIVRINAPQDFEGKLRTMMAAGTPPDLFYLQPEALAELASMKLIAPIEGRFAKEPKSWQQDFLPFLLDGFRYDTASQRTGAGGQLYGLPKDFSTASFYVNLDLFHAAGVPIPYNGWTWDEFEAGMRKITALGGTPGFENRRVFGGVLQLSSKTLQNILWTYGGDYFGPGGFRDVAIDSAACQAALKMIVRTRLTDKTVYNATGVDKDGGEEFFNGNIGCIGPIGRWMTPRYKDITRFKWDVVPVPYQVKPASQLFYTAWTMSSKTAHPDECYELMKFLSGRQGQVAMARLGLSVPCLKSVAFSSDFLSPSGLPRINSQTYLDALRNARIPQMPREPEFVRLVDDKITKSIQMGRETPLQSAEAIKAAWLEKLNSPLQRRDWPIMKWDLVLAVTAILLSLGGLIATWRAQKERLGKIDLAQERAGLAFIAPWLIGFLALTAGPIIVSLLLSFSQWSAMVPISEAKSVGTANYREIFRDSSFYQSLKVTLYYVLLVVPTGQIGSLAVALLMRVTVRGMACFRTIYFLPSVIGGPAVAVMWLQIFNNDYGILNRILRPLAHLLHTVPPDWFGVDADRWAVPGFVIMSLWSVGGGMIIYLAGMEGIPASLYESAAIDGAGILRRFWHVTLPMLSPLLFFNFVIGIIGSFQVFTQAYVMTGAGPDESSLFYVLNLYRQAFEFHKMGYASALAWILFLLVLTLTMTVFAGAKRLVYYGGFKN